MNTYIVYRNDTFDGELGILNASDISEAESKAKLMYGSDIYVVRQYSTTTTIIDPIWILLLLLLIAKFTTKRS